MADGGFNVKITHITIIKDRYGAEAALLDTDLPEAVYPFAATGQYLSMSCAKDTAEAYIKEHFPNIPVTVIGYTT